VCSIMSVNCLLDFTLLPYFENIFCMFSVIVGSDQPPLYPKPPVPYSTANSSRSSHGGTAPSSSRSAAAASGSSPHPDNDVTRQNPLAAFDPRDVSLIPITTTTTTTTLLVVVGTCSHFTFFVFNFSL